MPLLGWFWLINYSLYYDFLDLICMPNNIWFDAKLCEFYLFWVLDMFIFTKLFNAFCSGMQLNYLERVWFIQDLLFKFIRKIQCKAQSKVKYCPLRVKNTLTLLPIPHKLWVFQSGWWEQALPWPCVRTGHISLILSDETPLPQLQHALISALLNTLGESSANLWFYAALYLVI